VQTKPVIAIHPLDPEDASVIAPMKAAPGAARAETSNARAQFDFLMERVPPPGDVTFETGSLGGIAGLWAGMFHGFVASIGMIRAATLALDAIGKFLAARLQDGHP
jgi:hypothetical protein